MTTANAAFYFALTACSVLLLKVYRKHALRRGLPFPPGPTGLPIIGSVFNINIVSPWLTYEEWGKRYGGLVYTNLLGQDCVIINSAQVAQALLDQRSSIYSDRPYIATNKLFGMDFNTGLLRCGPQWRLHRKMFHVTLSKQSATVFRPMELQKIYQFIQNLLSNPQDYPLHCYTCSAAIIMAITYGYDVAPQNDRFVMKVVHFVDLFMEALTPERAALQSAFPILAHIPSWLPGGRYKKRAGECRRLAQDVLNDPVNYVKNCMLTDTASRSLVYDLFQNPIGNNSDQDYEEAVKAVAATVFLGGAETTHAVLLTFLLAMVLHPEVQTKAQEEIDRVVGNDCLPHFKDRANLPYIEAVFLETLRWQPVSPMGLPHMTTTSDVYKGMYIPAGALVLVNLWAIAHDEKLFPDPLLFNPERHMTPSGNLAGTVPFQVFGFGRRHCPGRYVADESVWAAVVSVLATLRIEKAKDHLGNDIEFVPEFTGGLSSCPKPFPCSIKIRSQRAEQLLYAHQGKE